MVRVIALFRQATVAVAVAVLAAVPAFAQESQRYGAWSYNVAVDDFSDERTHLAGTGSGDEVIVGVTCVHQLGNVPMLMINMRDGIFHNGEIELRWMGGTKDGEVESYTFIDQNEALALIGPSLDLDSIISSLKSHSELRLRFRRWRDERDTDRVSLNGAARAIDSLPCVNP